MNLHEIYYETLKIPIVTENQDLFIASKISLIETVTENGFSSIEDWVSRN